MAVYKNKLTPAGARAEKPYFQDGKFIVPAEWEDFWVRLWKWKLVRKLGILSPDEFKYLKQYEYNHGAITHWLAPEGLRPF